MPRHPVLLIHGYSDTGRSFERWRSVLESRGHDVTSLHVGNYVSLSNEVTIKDIAEGLDRAIRDTPGLGDDQPFDAIVHSTGMLVIRAWLTSSSERKRRAGRLKRLIALAPASFGSPLAHKGRSWLGSAFKGSWTPGPDFMEAGDEVLYGLEMGSAFSWELAHRDLIGEEVLYDTTPATPYVFVFCGDAGYGGLKGLVNPEASDGTVRWSACSLDTRKITLNVMDGMEGRRVSVAAAPEQDIPMLPVSGLNHATILRRPSEPLVEMVLDALEVDSAEAHAGWLDAAREATREARGRMRRWQQLVIRVVDERGDPVPDWNMRLQREHGGPRGIAEFDLDVHVYRRDPSYRCFHVDLDRLGDADIAGLRVRLIASTGTRLVAYHGIGSERVAADGRPNPRGKWDATIDLAETIGADTRFFFPFTTTLVEMCMNREPMPLSGRNEVFWWS